MDITNKGISEESYPDIYKLLDKDIDDPFHDNGGLEQRLLMGNYLAKKGYAASSEKNHYIYYSLSISIAINWIALQFNIGKETIFSFPLHLLFLCVPLIFTLSF